MSRTTSAKRRVSPRARCVCATAGWRRRTMAADPRIKIKVQIFCGKEIAMGPGKADLLEAIAREGSISAAGRTLGISYRRCWLLVDTMNRCWAGPLVETA